MNGTTRRNFLVGSVGLACSGMALAGARTTAIEPLPEGALEKMMPMRLGQWRAVEAENFVLPPKSELTERTYNDVMVRMYQDGGGHWVALLLAYGSLQGRDMQLHRPELCYPAAGLAIQSAQTLPLPLQRHAAVPARLLETASQSRKEQVLYWARVGDEFPTTQLSQRWSVVRQNLRGDVPDGMLVRFSTNAGDAAAALPMLSSFAQAMVGDVPASMRRLLVGDA